MIPVVELSRESADFAISSLEIIPIYQEYFSVLFNKDQLRADQLQNIVISKHKKMDQNVAKIGRYYHRSLISRLIIKKDIFNHYQALIKDWLFISTYMLNDSKKIIFLLQNTHELRATGGFIGSYLRLHLVDGIIENFQIADIYDVDGQFNQYLKPPLGVKKYLSEGGGWKVSDANWHPDFIQSMKSVDYFFNHGNEANTDIYIAVNLTLIEDILGIIGPIRVNNQQVTAHNLAILAREDRSQFIPGDRQKVNFLNSLLEELKLRLISADRSEFKKILDICKKSYFSRSFQVYALNQEIQNRLDRYDLALSLTSKYNFRNRIIDDSDQSMIDSDLLLNTVYLVESNVGINKANKGVIRDIDVSNQGEIVVDFTNTNNFSIDGKIEPDSANHLDYVNYQRVITSSNLVIGNIVIDGEKIQNIDYGLIQGKDGEMFNQYGFVITIQEQSSKSLTLKVFTDDNSPLLPLQLVKQPGTIDLD